MLDKLESSAVSGLVDRAGVSAVRRDHLGCGRWGQDKQRNGGWEGQASGHHHLASQFPSSSNRNVMRT